MRDKFPWWKIIVGFILYIFFHQMYGILGGGVLGAILGEKIESIYSHMKMYFFAYLVVSAIDYIRRRSQVTSAGSFWTARALIASAFPWMSIAFWFIPTALGFELGSVELAFSIVMTLMGLYFAFRLEEIFEGIQFRPSLAIMIWLAFLGALITYIGFSFHVPDNFF